MARLIFLKERAITTEPFHTFASGVDLTVPNRTDPDAIKTTVSKAFVEAESLQPAVFTAKPYTGMLSEMLSREPMIKTGCSEPTCELKNSCCMQEMVVMVDKEYDTVVIRQEEDLTSKAVDRFGMYEATEQIKKVFPKAKFVIVAKGPFKIELYKLQGK